MTSAQKIKANRANARASTGPKTAQGKTHSAKNALRHSLSLSIRGNQIYSKEVSALAREIAGENIVGDIQELACRIIEAQIDIIRVRMARHDLIARNIIKANDGEGEFVARNATLPMQKGRRAELLTTDSSASTKSFNANIEEPHKLAAALANLTKQLNLIDRYERRALSRRKFAIRAFDLARQQLL